MGLKLRDLAPAMWVGLFISGASLAVADGCAAKGQVLVRHPGNDIGPGVHIGDGLSVASEDDCMQRCLNHSDCNSAVYVTKTWSPGVVSKTCYRKKDVLGVSPLVPVSELRFVVLGCVATPAPPQPTDCPAGQEPTDTGGCADCAANFISPDGAACTECLPGTSPNNGTTCVEDPVSCSAGQEPTDTGGCADCAANFISPDGAACTECLPGTSPNNGTTCVEDPVSVCGSAVKVRYPGNDIGPGFHIGAGLSVTSEEDCLQRCLSHDDCNSAVYVTKTWSPGDVSKTCYRKEDVLGVSPLVAVSELRFVVLGCVPASPPQPPACTAGQEPDGAGCTQCADNYTSPGDAACEPCPAGTSSAGGQPCAACPPNTISSAGQACTATACTAGTEPSNGGCSPCANNYTSAGTAACEPCAAGTTSTSGDEVCTACPDGTSSLSGEACAPIVCAAGEELLQDGCTQCPKDSYSPGTQACAPCPDGKTSTRTGGVACEGPAGAVCTYNEDCPGTQAGPKFCNQGFCGDRPSCQAASSVTLSEHNLDGANLAVQTGLTTRQQCLDSCFTAVFCKAAVFRHVLPESPICYLKSTDPAEAAPSAGTSSDIVYCLDPKPTEHTPAALTVCTTDAECALPGICGAEGICVDTFAGTCPPLAKEQKTTNGGAIVNPVSVGGRANAVVLAYDHEREALCPTELNGEVLTITGQVIVREGSDENTTCKPCPEAECYVWQPNKKGTYVPECSGKLVIDEYGRFTITAKEPGNERSQGWGPDPYGHWHYDCQGCGGRYWNKFYRAVPDYVGENETTLAPALGYPDITNALTPVPGSTTDYTYTIVLEQGYYTEARERRVTVY